MTELTPEQLAEMRREAARQMGMARTAKKAAAVRENGKKGGRPRKKPIEETPPSTETS